MTTGLNRPSHVSFTYIFKIVRFSLLEQDLRKHSNAFGVIGLLYSYNRQLRHICSTDAHTVEMTNV